MANDDPGTTPGQPDPQESQSTSAQSDETAAAEAERKERWSREAYEKNKREGGASPPAGSAEPAAAAPKKSNGAGASKKSNGAGAPKIEERIIEIPPPPTASIEPITKSPGSPDEHPLPGAVSAKKKGSGPKRIVPVLIFICLAAVTAGAAQYFMNSKQEQTPSPQSLQDQTKKLAELTKAIESNPNDPKLYYDRAVIYYYDKDRAPLALTDLTKAIALNPKSADYYGLRANVASYVGDMDLANADANKAVELAPFSAWAYSSRAHVETGSEMYDKGIADCEKALKLAPTDYSVMGELADAYVGMQRYDDAGHWYEEQLRMTHPHEHPLTFTCRGLCRFHIMDFDGAIEDYNAALKLRPDFGMIKILRGFALAAKGNTVDAEADIKQGVIEESNPARGKRLEADYYRFIANFDRAIEEYDSAISLNPLSDHSFRNRAICFWHSKQLKNALADLQHAVKLNPRSSKSLSYLALVEEDLGMQKEADRDIDKAFHATVVVSPVYSNRAYIMFKRGKIDQALDDAKEALKLDRFNADAYKLIGTIYQSQGKTTEAQQYLDKAKQYFYPGSVPPVGW